MPRLSFGNRYARRGVRGRSAGGMKLRLIIGAVIALIALGSFFFATDVNPFTGDKQRVGSLTPGDELRLGLAAAPQMVQQMGGAVPRNDPRQQFVTEVGNRLLDAGGVNAVLREKEIPYQFTFTLLDDDQTVNAFALPGGPVFITEALLNRMDNEAQLAGVLGHEIGHVIERHGAEHMAKGSLGQQLVAAVATGVEDGSGRGQAAAAVAGMVNQTIQMKYGRDDELESDDWGLQFMVEANYDPREMVRVMEILKEASGGGGGGPEFLQTHPLPENRIDAIRSWIERTYPNGIPANLTAGRPL